jgi:hypothetical protein
MWYALTAVVCKATAKYKAWQCIYVSMVLLLMMLRVVKPPPAGAGPMAFGCC